MGQSAIVRFQFPVAHRTVTLCLKIRCVNGTIVMVVDVATQIVGAVLAAADLAAHQHHVLSVVGHSLATSASVADSVPRSAWSLAYRYVSSMCTTTAYVAAGAQRD